MQARDDQTIGNEDDHHSYPIQRRTEVRGFHWNLYESGAVAPAQSLRRKEHQHAGPGTSCLKRKRLLHSKNASKEQGQHLLLKPYALSYRYNLVQLPQETSNLCIYRVSGKELIFEKFLSPAGRHRWIGVVRPGTSQGPPKLQMASFQATTQTAEFLHCHIVLCCNLGGNKRQHDACNLGRSCTSPSA